MKILSKLKRRGAEVVPVVQPEPFFVPRGFKELDRYPLYEPHAYAAIIGNEATGEVKYVVDELQLSPEERKIFDRVVDILRWELKPPSELKNPKEYFVEETKRIIKKYKITFGEYAAVSWYKIAYYLERDLLGFASIDPLMRDENIEDISCDGVGKHVFVWHRKYESIPSSVLFKEYDDLDDLVVKLAHMAGKHISTAFPILDTMLPGLHRLAATFRREISTGGSTFTIRKFREDPITVIDQIHFRTLTSETAAYLWLCMEHKLPTLVMGVTGSGKTTLINAFTCLMRPTLKIVTIEDTPELRLPLENWVQLVSRPGYGFGTEKIGEVSLFDLIKVSLRYRPDVLIVGEVRGEEAYVLFQAIATGHGGVTSIHAETMDSAVRRLISPPMNIPSSYIPLVSLGNVIRRVRIETADGKSKIVRRLTAIQEVANYEDYRTVAEWDPFQDEFKHYFDKSIMLQRISEKVGKTLGQLLDEIKRRKTVLDWMAAENIRFYKDVARQITLYHAKPDEIYENALAIAEKRGNTA